MHPLTGTRLLDAWDRGDAEGDLDRAVTMLAAACPGAARGQIAGLGLPVLTRELLRLRLLTFGPALAGRVPCASCAARLEFSMSVPAVLERLGRLDAGGRVEWSVAGVPCALRAATAEDLAWASLAPDADSARRRLLERCVEIAGDAGAGRILDAALSDPLLVARFDGLHEGAEITCEVPCAGCGASNRADLDVGRFLWDEVRHAALRLLRDVHDLASAYGWPEAEILEMSRARRRAYLALVHA